MAKDILVGLSYESRIERILIEELKSLTIEEEQLLGRLVAIQEEKQKKTIALKQVQEIAL